MSNVHELTKLLESSLRGFSKIKDVDVRDAIYTLIEKLDTDLAAIEFGPSEDTEDAMNELRLAMEEASEEQPPKEVATEEVDEPEDEDDSVVEDVDDDEVVEDDEDDDSPILPRE